MKSIILTLSLLLVGAPAVFSGQSADEHFKLIHTAELAPLLAQPNVYVFDANSKETRTREGIIPGATPLASHNKYDVHVLPENKDSKVVFYCANEQCMASHAAAKRAVSAGYSDVNVLSDGIMGWKKNGQKVAKLNAGKS